MATTTTTALLELQQRLSMIKHPIDKRVFVGFDGFVDTIKKAVKQKRNFKTEYYNTLREFSERIYAATGKSGQIEMVTQKIKLGGNAPILSNTLGRLGISSFCLGSFGYPERHSVFSTMSEKCNIISVLNPGESDAIEFEDGKMIFSELSVFDHYDWQYIKKKTDIEQLRKAVAECNLLAFVDWVNLPHASDIWEGILTDIIKPSGKKDYLFLFDLCDPSKKTTEEIDEVLDLMSCFSSYGKVTLGLNENETLRIWSAINGSYEKSKLPDVKEAGDFLYKTMNIDCLLIHPIDRTIAFHQRETLELQGRLVRKPKVLTGGGDNLNAGYCLGLLSGFPLPQCMLLGMAASGSYIQNGTSPDIEAILEYLGVWINDLRSASESSNAHYELA
jgi:hypothetical protein